MLSECLSEAYNNDENDSIDEVNMHSDMEELLSLKEKMSAAKWSKIQARLLKRSEFGGPCPKPNFSGSQEFFKKFLAHSTYGFILHFKELLIKSIMDDNDNVDTTKSKTEIYDTILR